MKKKTVKEKVKKVKNLEWIKIFPSPPTPHFVEIKRFRSCSRQRRSMESGSDSSCDFSTLSWLVLTFAKTFFYRHTISVRVQVPFFTSLPNRPFKLYRTAASCCQSNEQQQTRERTFNLISISGFFWKLSPHIQFQQVFFTLCRIPSATTSNRCASSLII